MSGPGSVAEVLLVFGKLGLTSFGGPIAHLGYFRAELVERRRWVDEAGYADLVALCQLLPGPASSQVAMALGIERAGLAGGLAAWVGFTLPSALALALFALALGELGAGADRLHGLKVVAVPVVALAVHGMWQRLCPDPRRATIAVAAAAAALALPSALTQVGVIALGGALGWALLREPPAAEAPPAPASRVSLRAGLAAWALFALLLLGLPLLRAATAAPGVDVFERFYRVGALVFGGGHVVLPLLEGEVVDPGWTTRERFLAGYGAAQAVPGPLFSFAAYLGFVLDTTPTRWAGAALALAAIFLPSLLLVVGALPLRARLRASVACQAALRGTNAAVVGLLVAAFYDPVWTVAVRSRADFALALAGLLALAAWRAPPWAVVAVTALAGAGFA